MTIFAIVMDAGEISRAITSAVAVAAVFVINRLARPALQRLNVIPSQQVRLRRAVRYSLGLLLVVFLVIVWADELQNAALVISAFAMAIAITSKDINTCFLGWWMKHMTGSFRTGDYVQIGEHRGIVLEYGILTTKLVEFSGEAPTGRVVVLPNNFLLTKPVRNETFASHFTWQEIPITLGATEDWALAERLLLQASSEVSAEGTERLKRELTLLQDKFGSQPFPTEPTVNITVLEDGKLKLTLRVPLPLTDLSKTRQRIVRRYLELRQGILGPQVGSRTTTATRPNDGPTP